MIVCIVDDIIENARYVQRILSDYTTRLFSSPHEALEFCSSHPVDLLVADQKMPGMTGLELVRELRDSTEDFVAILISAYTDSEDLIDAVNSNLVYKYIMKPFSPHVLRDHVNRALEWLHMTRTNRRLKEQLLIQNQVLVEENRALRAGSQPIFDIFTGDHPSIKKVQELARLYAGTDAPVLITGETGSGKELLARVLHSLSRRSDRPFVALNCSAFQESILESELFGHRRGAFTGATRDKPGILTAADGGTVFLDEIGDLPLELQPKLLRVVQFGTFIPVGGVEEMHVDIRFISATNKDLPFQSERGLFREDLLYRINAFHIALPPLRERPADMEAIIERIAAARGIRLPPFGPAALQHLHAHPFPGNVRELRNVIDRLDLLCRAHKVEVVDDALIRAVLEDGGPESQARNDHVQSEHRQGCHDGRHLPAVGEVIDLRRELESLRREIILRVLEQEGGNISRTATRLGVSRQGLKNSLRSYGLMESNHGHA